MPRTRTTNPVHSRQSRNLGDKQIYPENRQDDFAADQLPIPESS